MSKEEKSPLTVTYHSAADVRPTPQPGLLEERWLHQVFVISHKPSTWSDRQLFVTLLGAAASIWLLFRPVSARLASHFAVLYTLFAMSDWLLLRQLPQTGRSFGPVGSQLLIMTVPRLGVALLTWLISRVSRTWATVTFVGLQLFGTATYLWGTLYEPFALTTSLIPFSSPKIESKARRLRLLHLSDLHIERLTRREQDLLAEIDHLKPDLIVITGDYTNLSYVNEPQARADIQQLLSQLDAPYGVYAVLGSPPADPRDSTPSLFAETKVRLLRDEVAVLEFEDGQKLSLLGLDCEHDLEADMLVCKRMLDICPEDSLRVLLYHSPELMPQVQQEAIDLYLCGHTHGGQLRMPLYGALLTSSVTGKQYEMGEYTENGTTLYVSRGIGLEGLSAPRMRLLCQPEIILFTLLGEDK